MSWWRKIFAGTAVKVPAVAPPETAAATPAPIDAAAALRQGNALVEAGRLDEASNSYRQVLALEPDSVAARVNLAFTLLNTGHPAQSVPLLEQAIALAPNNADAHFMLGSELLRQGQMHRARDSLQQAIALQPSLAWAYPPLCRAMFELGDTEQALQVATRGLQVAPDLPELHHYLGNVRLAKGDFEPAAKAFGEALQRQPQSAVVRTGLARALVGLGSLDEAQDQLRRAVSDGPSDMPSWCSIGNTFGDLGLLDDALAAYRQAARLSPDNAHVQTALGNLEQRRGNHSASAQAYARAIALEPQSAQAHCNLGTAYLAQYRYDDMTACVERALAIDPDFAPAHALAATRDLGRGHFDRALPAFERAIALDGQNLEYRSSLLLSLTYTGDLSRYLAAARDFGSVVASLAAPFRDWQVSMTDGDAPRPLRVGLVSGDLRSHPVGYFIESVVPELARHGIDLVGFPTSPHSDELTARLKRRLAGWHPINGMTDASAAHLIRASAVHVLLDLAGHTAHNRLSLFAWCPAPVQASWLGYFASTGVAQIDYVLTDDIVVSDDSPEQFTERAWRLPRTRLCFSEPGQRDDFPISALPAVGRGHATLSCFQNFNKINDRVLDAWGAIFRGAPGACLLLQSRQSGDPQGNEAMLRRLEAAGIERSRVTIKLPSDRRSYLKSYADVDFALDTFPFPGGTTTCEALWMGVPTLTLRGQTMLERQGVGLMTCAGLPQWVATDADDYVRRAVAFASAPDQLVELRKALRDRVVASPIFDASTFSTHLAEALRAIWRDRPRHDAEAVGLLHSTAASE